jgi:aminopeptidase N
LKQCSQWARTKPPAPFHPLNTIYPMAPVRIAPFIRQKTGWALALLLGVLLHTGTAAQPLNSKEVFTKDDTLRGSITPERAWWDVLHYTITVQPDFNSKSLKGEVTIQFTAKPGRQKPMQIDLQRPLVIDKVWFRSGSPDAPATEITDISHRNNVWWLNFGNHAFPITQKPVYQYITIQYHGTPREAIRPPWDGGWIWKKDRQQNPWMSVACQGLGASVWYPCKDHQSDEPDFGAVQHIIVPDSLTAVGNGRLTDKKALGNGLTQYTWTVKSPINNYCIVPYIGKYANFGETYQGEKGPLSLNYWVLAYNKEKAQKHFTDAPRTMQALEHWFGPYPFYEDGYQLVESPHLGMEHQSATAYGNNYQKGYEGMDLSGSGWGLKWDFIIVHETGHDWFANNVSTKDIADMWVHEGFTNYCETLFTEYFYGKKAGSDYVAGIRGQIENDRPVIGPYGVNKEGSGDMYYKGANLLHTIRHVIGNDEKFRGILRGLNKDFYHVTTTSKEVEAYISKKAGIDFSKVFDQYLRTVKIPTLLYKIENGALRYKWGNCVPGFAMPVKVALGDADYQLIYPSDKLVKTLTLPKGKNGNSLKVDRNFYVQTGKL